MDWCCSKVSCYKQGTNTSTTNKSTQKSIHATKCQSTKALSFLFLIWVYLSCCDSTLLDLLDPIVVNHILARRSQLTMAYQNAIEKTWLTHTWNRDTFSPYGCWTKNMGNPPKSSILTGFSIIFTIHFGGFPPIFGSTPIFQKKNFYIPLSKLWKNTTQFGEGPQPRSIKHQKTEFFFYEFSTTQTTSLLFNIMTKIAISTWAIKRTLMITSHERLVGYGTSSSQFIDCNKQCLPDRAVLRGFQLLVVGLVATFFAREFEMIESWSLRPHKGPWKPIQTWKTKIQQLQQTIRVRLCVCLLATYLYHQRQRQVGHSPSKTQG